MNKKMAAVLIALVLVVIAVIAGVYAVNLNVDEVKLTEVITVTEEEKQEAQMNMPDETAETAENAGAGEEMLEATDIFGTITEITEEYVMIDAGELGMVQANTSDDTILEGAEQLEIGQTVVILYDGKMTRSLPAQITALKIGVYAVSGTVQEIIDGQIIIEQEGDAGQVVLTLPENAPEIAVGDAVMAYTTGVSTMSLPPQMNAISIVK